MRRLKRKFRRMYRLTQWSRCYNMLKISKQTNDLIFYNKFENLFSNKKQIKPALEYILENKKFLTNIPITQRLMRKKRIFVPTVKSFFPFSDLFILYQKGLINIFISYSTPTLYTYRYFWSFYKRLLKYRLIRSKISTFFFKKGIYNLIKQTSNIDKNIKELRNVRRSVYHLIINNLSVIQKYTKKQNFYTSFFNQAFILYIKSNLQYHMKSKVNLFFFDSKQLKLYRLGTVKKLSEIEEQYKRYSQQRYLNKLVESLKTNSSSTSIFVKKMIFNQISNIRNTKSLTFYVNELSKPYLYHRALSSRMTIALFLESIQHALLDTSAKALLALIIHQFKRAKYQKKFFFYLKNMLTIFFNKYNKEPAIYLKGIKIVINGRLDGTNRTRKRSIIFGNVGLISKSKVLDFAKSDVTTKYGVIGIHIYLFA